MRFCFLSPHQRSLQVLAGDTRSSGGAEAQVAHLAAAFAELGHEVTLIYGSGGAGEMTRLRGVACVDAYPAWRRPASLDRFWRALGALDPEVLYARLPDDFLGLAGLFAALRPRARFVYALAHDDHCNPWRTFSYKPLVHNTLYALGLRSATAVAVQHEGQVPLVRPHVRGPIVLIPNLRAAPAERQRPFDNAEIDAIWVAQIRPEKRLSALLDLAERLPGLRFAVVGGFMGAMPAEEEARLRERLGRLPNLTYFGAVLSDEVRSVLVRSKVLVNTSSGEGFPNTMLEAWSLGVPVVSLAIDPGGVVAREGLGLVSGSLERLADDLLQLCGSKAANEACGARGAAYVAARHSRDAVVRAFEQIVPGAGQGRVTPQASGI